LTTNIEQIAQEFTDFLNEWHSYREPYDDQLDAWLHGEYAKIKQKRNFIDWNSIYFSPSSANSCDRELYVKALKMERDAEDIKPWQRRWTALGTAVGDWLQREILLAERHYEKYTLQKPPFVMARTEEGQPFFEDFVHGQHFFEHGGEKFSLVGTCDGVLIHQPTGKRIGLEIKSRQTSYSETGYGRMKAPKPDHVAQITCYSLMYDVDEYLIVYINTSKKAWFMDDEEFVKSPDFRVFGVEVSDYMKRQVLDKFANVAKAVREQKPPKLNLDKFKFNNFKKACALSLDDAEFDEIRNEVKRVMKSGLPNWKKQAYYEAFEFIRDVREKEAEG
jgi:hypothetical protein